jgi:hypothetical protein
MRVNTWRVFGGQCLADPTLVPAAASGGIGVIGGGGGGGVAGTLRRGLYAPVVHLSDQRERRGEEEESPPESFSSARWSRVRAMRLGRRSRPTPRSHDVPYTAKATRLADVPLTFRGEGCMRSLEGKSCLASCNLCSGRATRRRPASRHTPVTEEGADASLARLRNERRATNAPLSQSGRGGRGCARVAVVGSNMGRGFSH